MNKLTKKQNLSLAEKELLSIIYSGCVIENINVTFNEMQAIVEGHPTSNENITDIDIEKILNLKDAWKFVMNTIEDAITIDYICKVNEFVSRNESLEWGVLRNGDVGISGTEYKPPIPNKIEISEWLKNFNFEKRDDSLQLFLSLCRRQIFWDGNKRTSHIVANKSLIMNGNGIFLIKTELKEEFNTRMIDYYDNNNLERVSDFFENHCLPV
jgi:hypothetical protein